MAWKFTEDGTIKDGDGNSIKFEEIAKIDPDDGKVKNVKGEEADVVVADAQKLGGKEATEFDDNVDVLLKASGMNEAQFRAWQASNREKYVASGVVRAGKTYRDYTGNWGVNIGDGFARPAQTSSIAMNTIYMGNSRRYGEQGLPLFNFNGSLVTLKAIDKYGSDYNSDLANVFKFPEASTLSSVVSDSKSLPVNLRQGDFIILNDLDRELVANGTFDDNTDGWRGAVNAELDVDNNALKITVKNDLYYTHSNTPIKVIKNVKYIIKFDYLGSSDDRDRFGIYLDGNGGYLPNWGFHTHHSVGSYEIEFTATTNGVITLGIVTDNTDNSTDRWWKFDNVSVKQVKSTPVVALTNQEANTDIYENVQYYEGRDSISRTDLLLFEYFEELVDEKDIVYRNGMIQDTSSDDMSIPNKVEPDWFTGYETYSLLGVWQQPNDLVGKGYRWSTMSRENKIKFVSDPKNLMFLNKDGNWVQGRFRARTIKGIGNLGNYGYVLTDGGSSALKLIDNDGVSNDIYIKP